MNDHDLLTQRVNDALIGVDPTAAARAVAALAEYRPGDGVGALILLTTLEMAVGDEAAHAALGLKGPAGLVYCCPSMGWVTPEERSAHQMDDDYGDPPSPPAAALTKAEPANVWDDDYIDNDGRLTEEGMQRLYVELDLGIPVARSKLPDTPAVRDFRKRAAVEVAAIKAKGHSVVFTAD